MRPPPPPHQARWFLGRRAKIYLQVFRSSPITCKSPTFAFKIEYPTAPFSPLSKMTHISSFASLSLDESCFYEF